MPVGSSKLVGLGQGFVPGQTIWNPADTDGNITLSSGNRVASISNAAGTYKGTRSVKSTNGTNKLYAEITIGTSIANNIFGVGTSGVSLSSGYLGSSSIGWGVQYGGDKVNNDIFSSFTGGPITNGDIFMIAFDSINGDLYFGRNGSWFDSGSPTFTGVSANVFLFASMSGTASATIAQNPIYSLPAGYDVWA